MIAEALKTRCLGLVQRRVSADASMREETSLVFLISALRTPGDREGFGCVKGPRVSGLWLHHVNAAAALDLSIDAEPLCVARLLL
jgi:hypothetical protein